ncbi:hypothetical protein P364_0132910 [Paenibacillus sp. MAEPY2]|nr:hypothetical protein P363_0133270 [Paenibacillus sp. MAEPY1]KGP77498.1 hypothetical protein P364_0132910 [Paenibacillus sp. MAEPY2]
MLAQTLVKLVGTNVKNMIMSIVNNVQKRVLLVQKCVVKWPLNKRNVAQKEFSQNQFINSERTPFIKFLRNNSNFEKEE